jgi:uncharacterized protein
MASEKDPLKYEERYFLEKERAAIEKLRKEREERLHHEAKTESAKVLDELKKAHWMRCPKCGHEMKEIQHEGIAVDRCTRCEGIYLDRGEMEDLFLKKQEERRSIFRKILGI